MRNIRSNGGREWSDSAAVILDRDLFLCWVFIFCRVHRGIEQWVLMIKLLQLGVQGRMEFLQLTGFLKKTFRGHGEKLRWILGAIGVQDRFPSIFGRPAELLKFCAQDPGPSLVAMAHLREGCPFKERSAVNQAVLLIELVGKLVYDHVPVLVQFQRPGDCPIPRQNHGPVRPGFSASRLLAFGNRPAIASKRQVLAR